MKNRDLDMAYIDFMSPLHKATKRDYLARVNDPEFPKAKAAELAKQWGYDYWDGDRRICYGGYKYIQDRWAPVAHGLVKHYNLKPGSRVLDVGCGKGFLLYEIKRYYPQIEISGIDISSYAIDNSKNEIKEFLSVGSASKLPYNDEEFDLAISLNTFHNLTNAELERAFREFLRVSKRQYFCVESYRNEAEKANLLFWQVTCEQFNSPADWEWWMKKSNYKGDWSFIYFE